jgi:hypothetical protein
MIAMLSRIYPNEPDGTDRTEIGRVIDGVANAFPGFLRRMVLSPNEVRVFLRREGIERPYGVPLNKIPVVRVGFPEVTEAIERYGVKLGCALHYLHHKRIVPMSGTILVKWYSNIQAMQGKLPEDLIRFVKRGRQLIRNRKMLNDQFSYRYATDKDGDVGLYLSIFRQSFAVVSFVYMNSADAPEEAASDRRTPFVHHR